MNFTEPAPHRRCPETKGIHPPPLDDDRACLRRVFIYCAMPGSMCRASNSPHTHSAHPPAFAPHGSAMDSVFDLAQRVVGALVVVRQDLKTRTRRGPLVSHDFGKSLALHLQTLSSETLKALRVCTGPRGTASGFGDRPSERRLAISPKSSAVMEAK